MKRGAESCNFFWSKYLVTKCDFHCDYRVLPDKWHYYKISQGLFMAKKDNLGALMCLAGFCWTLNLKQFDNKFLDKTSLVDIIKSKQLSKYMLNEPLNISTVRGENISQKKPVEKKLHWKYRFNTRNIEELYEKVVWKKLRSFQLKLLSFVSYFIQLK